MYKMYNLFLERYISIISSILFPLSLSFLLLWNNHLFQSFNYFKGTGPQFGIDFST